MDITAHKNVEGSALDQKQTADLLCDVILNASEQRPLFLVGHSQKS